MHSPIRKTHPLIKIINWAIIDLPAPINLSYMWNIGSLLIIGLLLQLISGLLLSIHYCPNIHAAFSSCAHISQDVNYGWLIRSIHSNGASLIFLCLYFHTARNIYYSSYFIVWVWKSGIVLFLLLIGSAFLGYVLPWGQIRFWGATVITNLLSAVPYVGKSLVIWIWGGFAIDNATLNRFFSLHFILPFIIVVITFIHILFLHQTGSNNPLGLNSNENKIPFHWFYLLKDLTGILVALLGLTFIVIYSPLLLRDPENWTPANPIVTPIHIKPEWYFLWAYAILRSIPNKLGGVIAIFSAILILLLLPYTHTQAFLSNAFYPFSQVLFWIFINVLILLTWIGGQPIEPPYDFLGKVLTMLYFRFFLLKPLSAFYWDKIIIL